MIYDMDDVGRVWSDLKRKEDGLKWGGQTPGFGNHYDSMGRPANASSTFGFAWGNEQMGRVNRVRRALDDSGPMSQRMIAQSLSDIELSAIWHILIAACQDIALYYGGSAVAGGFIGGAGGALLAGVGAVPGMTMGAAAGAQVGTWALGLLGLTSLVGGVADAIPEALQHYAKGFQEAWGPTRQEHHQRVGHGARGDPSSGAFHLARGHVILIGTIVAVFAAYVTAGRSDMLNKIRQSPRLGPKVVKWVEENQEKLRQHLANRTRGRGVLASEELAPARPRREPIRKPEGGTSGGTKLDTKTAPERMAEYGANKARELVEGAYSLVGANRAVIDPRKITDYALNPAHPVGGNKAKVFDSALGFNQGNAADLMSQLRLGVMENTPIVGKVDQYGSRFTVDIPVIGPAGNATVRSGWIYKPSSNVPELATVFVK
ncbi:MAG: hypothetical protein V4754_07700 [Pseudomonadota bacterium]